MHHFVSSVVRAPPSYPLLPLASRPQILRRLLGLGAVLRPLGGVALDPAGGSPSLPARAMP